MRTALQIVVLLAVYLACQDMTTGACSGGCGKSTEARSADALAQ